MTYSWVSDFAFCRTFPDSEDIFYVFQGHFLSEESRFKGSFTVELERASVDLTRR